MQPRQRPAGRDRDARSAWPAESEVVQHEQFPQAHGGVARRAGRGPGRGRRGPGGGVGGQPPGPGPAVRHGRSRNGCPVRADAGSRAVGPSVGPSLGAARPGAEPVAGPGSAIRGADGGAERAGRAVGGALGGACPRGIRVAIRVSGPGRAVGGPRAGPERVSGAEPVPDSGGCGARRERPRVGRAGGAAACAVSSEAAGGA
jgi:hypothetical protein